MTAFELLERAIQDAASGIRVRKLARSNRRRGFGEGARVDRTLQSSYSDRRQVGSEMVELTSSRNRTRSTSPAPRYSRWSFLQDRPPWRTRAGGATRYSGILRVVARVGFEPTTFGL